MPTQPMDSSRMSIVVQLNSQTLTVHSYVDEGNALDNHLITFEGGSAQMRVDSHNVYDGGADYYNINGVGRPSVRIETADSWTHGLFIADIKHMPTTTDSSGCGVWPAFWTLGSGTWPYSEHPFTTPSVELRLLTYFARWRNRHYRGREQPRTGSDLYSCGWQLCGLSELFGNVW